MARIPLLVAAALTVLGACAAPQSLTGRADNDMLRFSAMNYTLAQDITH